MLTPNKQTGRFIHILADGLFHETVSQDTEGAVKREYETSDGTKGEKWELVYNKIDAKIVNVQFHDGEYGEQIQITFNDGENGVILSQTVSSNFGEDILKKLPNINFSEKVAFVPYAFEDEKTKKPKKGVSIYQGDKVANFFYDTEKQESKNGYPIPEGDTTTYKSDDWKLFYLQARKFLTNYTKTNIVPNFANRDQEVIPEDGPRYPDAEEEGINPADVPF